MQNWDKDPIDRSSGTPNQQNAFFQTPDTGADTGGMTSASGVQNGAPGMLSSQPSIQLPKGGGAIRGIDEKFKVNAASGTSSFSLSLPYSPSRAGFVPPVTLDYSSGNGNSAFGLGWSLGIPSIRRRTYNYLPTYEDAWDKDIFQLSDTEDLVPVLTESGGVWIASTEPRTVGTTNYIITYYRPRIEGAFSRIERWTNLANGDNFWRVLSVDNSTSFYGLTPASRVSDPANPGRIFEWMLCEAFDDKGNLSVLNYKLEDGVGVPVILSEKNHAGNCTQIYLSSIWYGNIEPFYPTGAAAGSGGTGGEAAGETTAGGTGDAADSGTPWGEVPGEDQFLFRAVFDYGEHDTVLPVPQDIYPEIQPWGCRKDPFSSYRSGFDIRTYRRCSRVLMFHCLPQNELPQNPYLVRSLNLFYDDDLSLLGNGDVVPGFSFLVKATQYGYTWDGTANSYSSLVLPDIDMQYQQHEWNVQVQEVSAASRAGAPTGVDDRSYQWVDLFSEGIMGILTEQGDGWYYKSNLGGGSLAAAMPLGPIPSYRGLTRGLTSVRELEGDGVKYLVQDKVAPRAYFRLAAAGPDLPPNGQFAAVGGQPISSGGQAAGPGSAGLSPNGQWQKAGWFDEFPVLDPKDLNARYLDLNEDGKEDILYTGDQQFRWYESLGEKGFCMAGTIPRAFDEEKGPAVVFSDSDQSIFLADMSGDGLVDIVRIRNGEICYWPNLGYGRFGSKVGMDNAPVFDSGDDFNPSLLRLADVDGSGTTDLIYLGRNYFRVWMNVNGNGWPATPEIISPFPRTDSVTTVEVLDFLGTGTACIVCSSPYSNEPFRYIDLMGGKKPCLLTGYSNNCGKVVALEYTSSTAFYLADKQAGIPWITRLPFPVQCLSKVTTSDLVRETVFTNTYAYRHGYYDPYDKEFRGFARVEQQDTESFEQFVLNSAKNVVEQDLYQPPVRTVTWLHTGAFLRHEDFLSLLSGEYFQNTAFTEYDMPEPVLPAGLDPDDLHEAYRALKGLTLRTEVYSNDGSPMQALPYSTTQTNGLVTLIQPQGSNRYAVFMLSPSESITYRYERLPADPRILHSFILSIDQYGNITKGASIVYPRVSRPAGAAAIPDVVWSQQDQLHITTNENDYTNDITGADAYRLRVLSETRAFEIGGLTQPAGFYFAPGPLSSAITGIPTIPYEQDFTGVVQQRLYDRMRQYFAANDLSGALPLGQLASLGIAWQSLQLNFTQGLVTKYYGAKVPGTLLTSGMYTHSEGDADWWAPSGTLLYTASPQDAFYLPYGSKDVFGNISTISYDSYFLLVNSTTDALLNISSAVNDYRILQAALVTDPNLNRTAIQTDELGMVIALALMGKSGGTDGDTLADPTMKLEYEVLNWQSGGQPNQVHALARLEHGAANTGWLESYAYSDGSGSVVMVKEQAAPGMASQWNPATQSVEQIYADPRWIGNGRTILNNKGNPVKKYEPYFSTNNGYETESALVETGMTAIFYYDAPGRNIRTTLPNGTFVKVAFDSWMSVQFDTNDTVMDSPWYASLGSPNPAGPEPADPNQRAAWLAAQDYNTPVTIHQDGMGRDFYTISDYGGGVTAALYALTDFTRRSSLLYDQLGRNIAQVYRNLSGQTIYSMTAEKGEGWRLTDAMGRMLQAWDNDICSFTMSYDGLNRPVSTFETSGAGTTILSTIVYGEIFPTATAQNMNLLGKAYQVYDQAGAVTIDLVDFKGNVLAAARSLCKDYTDAIDWTPLKGLTTIGAIQAAALPLLETEQFNSSQQVDALNRPVVINLPGGSIITPTYDAGSTLATLSGNIMGAATVTPFLTAQTYNARGQRLIAQYGNQTSINYTYDPATFRLTNILTRQHPADPASESLQNISYYFDPAGNITQIMDDAQQTHFFKNVVVYPENKFTYDALYQLVSATGREHAGLGMDTQRSNLDIPVLSPIPEANDASAVRNYTENYSYDLCGNLLSLQHVATGASWTQRYQYQYQVNPADITNRLTASSLPGDGPGVFSGVYGYADGADHGLHGNMTSMPALPTAGSLSWNSLDRLTSVNLGGGGMAYYVNNQDGGRIRKIIERPGGLIQERIYLGPVEIYRERTGASAPTLERYTLHISDSRGRFVQVDIKTIDTGDSDPDNALAVPNIKYQYANSLGSAMLETDETGQILSYEEYHPFGTSSYRVTQAGNDISLKRYRFSGKEHDDETGLYYFGARYYAAWLGRWTSSDPAGFVKGGNLFSYCSNNPVSFHDPDGRNEWTISDKPKDILKAQTTPGRKAGKKYEDWVRRNNRFTSDGKTFELQPGTGKLNWINGHWAITGATINEVDPAPADNKNKDGGGGDADPASKSQDKGDGATGGGDKDKGSGASPGSGVGDGGPKGQAPADGNADKGSPGGDKQATADTPAEKPNPILEWLWKHRPNAGAAGSGTVTTYDSAQRQNYLTTNEARSKAAQQVIKEAGAEGNVAKAVSEGENVSELRNITRIATQNKLSPGGKALSKAIEGPRDYATMLETYAKRLPGSEGGFAAETTDAVEIARRIAVAAGDSRGALKVLAKGGRILGPLGIALGVGIGIYEVVEAPEGQKGRTAARVTGEFVGGLLGASEGMSVGVAAAGGIWAALTFLGVVSGPIGWLAIGLGIVGAVAGAWLFSKIGGETGEGIYDLF